MVQIFCERLVIGLPLGVTNEKVFEHPFLALNKLGSLAVLIR